MKTPTTHTFLPASRMAAVGLPCWQNGAGVARRIEKVQAFAERHMR
jgi:hypothetical protein